MTSKAGWRTRREMVLVNQGLETKIVLNRMAEVEDRFKLTVRERTLGGLPVIVSEQVYTREEGIAQFKELCRLYVDHDYEHDENLRVAFRFDDTNSDEMVGTS